MDGLAVIRTHILGCGARMISRNVWAGRYARQVMVFALCSMSLQLLMQTMAVCSCLQPGGCCYSRHGCLVCCTNVGSGAPLPPHSRPAQKPLFSAATVPCMVLTRARFGSAQRA